MTREADGIRWRLGVRPTLFPPHVCVLLGRAELMLVQGGVFLLPWHSGQAPRFS